MISNGDLKIIFFLEYTASAFYEYNDYSLSLEVGTTKIVLINWYRLLVEDLVGSIQSTDYLYFV